MHTFPLVVAVLQLCIPVSSAGERERHEGGREGGRHGGREGGRKEEKWLTCDLFEELRSLSLDLMGP